MHVPATASLSAFTPASPNTKAKAENKDKDEGRMSSLDTVLNLDLETRDFRLKIDDGLSLETGGAPLLFRVVPFRRLARLALCCVPLANVFAALRLFSPSSSRGSMPCLSASGSR